MLARVAESAVGQTWPEIRRQLDRIAAGTFAGPAGTFRQRTEIAPAQAATLEKLGIDPPPGIYQLTPPRAADQRKHDTYIHALHLGTGAFQHVRIQFR